MKFALSTFKFGLSWDSNSIYNDLTKRPSRTFDVLLARVDEFSRDEDDDRAVNRSNFKRNRWNDRREEGLGRRIEKTIEKLKRSSAQRLLVGLTPYLLR